MAWCRALRCRSRANELAQLRSDLGSALADKPGKIYLWGILAALLAAYAAGLAAIAVIR